MTHQNCLLCLFNQFKLVNDYFVIMNKNALIFLFLIFWIQCKNEPRKVSLGNFFRGAGNFFKKASIHLLNLRRCGEWINQFDHVENKPSISHQIINAHYFRSGQSHFSPSLIPISECRKDPIDLVRRIFRFAQKYCRLRNEKHNEGCLYICPTTIGYHADGLTPLTAIFFKFYKHIILGDFELRSVYPVENSYQFGGV